MNLASGLLGKPAEVSVTRALILCATGALVGLSIAGYGLFTAAGTTTRTVPAENVAIVNQRPILRSDFIAQLEMETGKRLQDTSREEQLKVLDEMVREELLVQRALELDFAETDQNSRTALAAAISSQAVAEVTTSTPSEAQLRDYFTRFSARYATEGVMSLRDFVASSDAAAASRAAQQLRAGIPFEKLIADGALTESSHQVEEYYFTLAYRLGDLLFNAVNTLPAGGVSDPIAVKGALHIVLVEKNVRPEPLRFEVARSRVASDYFEGEQLNRMNMTLRFLRERAKILISADYSDYKP